MVRSTFAHGRLRLYLLRLLDESPRHGYDLMRALEERFLGTYVPSAGTIYPRLSRLEDEGLVTHTDSEGRKVYAITEAGRRELQSRAGDLEDLEAEIGRLVGSVREVASEITNEVHSSLTDLRRELKLQAGAAKREQRRLKREGKSRNADDVAWAAATRTPAPASELDAALDGFLSAARELLAAVAPTSAANDAVPAVRRVLDRALDELARAVTPPGDH
ncbi:MAG: PadR family transcriptional regulator [Actinomycetales bacterium]